MISMKTQYTNKTIDKIIVVLVAVLTVLLVIIISLIFQFNLIENLVLSWVFTTLYSIFAFWVVGDLKISRVIEKPVYIEKPIYIEKPVTVIKEIVKEVPIQIPIENKTIEVVEKPVTVIKEVFVKRVMPRVAKLEIPRYNFLASRKARRYHKRNCRLGKLIKKKYKIHSNSQAFFKRKKYKACKICIK